MGDLSAEPSMEDILASIKRVIKEGDAPPVPRRAPPRPVEDEDRDGVLELNEPMSAPTPAPTVPAPPAPPPTPVAEERGFAARPAMPASAAPAAPAPAPAPTPAPAAAVADDDDDTPPVISAATAEATRGALGALSRLVVKPEADGDGTLEGLVRDMLRPMLSEWLDQNLPHLVEQMVAKEIARITAGSA